MVGLQPDLILTQATCDVCAVDASQVDEAVAKIDAEPAVLTVDPDSFSDVLDDIQRIGDAVNNSETAASFTSELLTRVDEIKASMKTAVVANGRPRTAFLDWTDPPMRAGHWVNEMIELAGGDASFQPEGASEPLNFQQIKTYDPEVLVVAPCGFGRDRATAAIEDLQEHAGWSNMTAVNNGDGYAVDGSALFNRPSHRLVESLELLQWCVHPEVIELSDTTRNRVKQFDQTNQQLV